MGRRITAAETFDIRFPTSQQLDGSDAVHTDPDYSAAYVILRTDAGDGVEGHGFCFTLGRGNEIEVAALEALVPLVVGLDLADIVADSRSFSRLLTQDSQMRWLGPEKGVVHMAAAAIITAVWDLAAKTAGKPLWKYLADLTPEQLAAMVDYQYLSDALTEEEAVEMLRRAESGKAARERLLMEHGYPAYATSPGWLGYSDAKLVRLCREAVEDGFTLIKLKVGGTIEDDQRRLRLAREAVGPDVLIAVDANQKWDVGEAIEWMGELASHAPYWIEEPTSPDDILGHAAIRRAVAPIKVATGEAVQNRVVFKQLLQAGAIDIMQIDATRVGGVNENIANLLLAAKFGVPVVPHAGGVGLCEVVQHLAMLDFVAIGAEMEGRSIEFVDHLHQHFVDPVVVIDGSYVAPGRPGFSSQIRPESLDEFAYPTGPAWRRTTAR